MGINAGFHAKYPKKGVIFWTPFLAKTSGFPWQNLSKKWTKSGKWPIFGSKLIQKVNPFRWLSLMITPNKGFILPLFYHFLSKKWVFLGYPLQRVKCVFSYKSGPKRGPKGGRCPDPLFLGKTCSASMLYIQKYIQKGGHFLYHVLFMDQNLSKSESAL